MVTFSSGVALAAYEGSITGTDHTDILSGTGQDERILGLGAGDQLNGGGGADLVNGGKGQDELGDGNGTDIVYGGAGADNLIGQSDTSLDHFHGGSGNDLFQPRDVPAVEDAVDCGPGTDTVYADEADDVKGDCERVHIR